MAIRKGDERLHKECKKCGADFEPTGKYNFVCSKCNTRSNDTYWHRLQRLSRRKKTGAKK